MWLDNLGGRKFVLALIAVLAGCAIAILSPKGLSTETVALLLGIVAAFNVSNAMVTTKMAGQPTPAGDDATPADEPVAPAPPPVDLSHIHNALDNMANALHDQENKAQAHAQALMTMQQAMETTQKVAKAALSLRQS